MWLRDNDPAAYAAARTVLMPKDFINLRLTGEIAMDYRRRLVQLPDESASRRWSDAMIDLLGINRAKLPPIREPTEILGAITREAARDTGLMEGTPVLVGGADYPVALLGSGVCRPGLASDVTGTSCILTLIAEAPLLDPEICNVATIEGHWGPFVLLETGGDAMRWARRAFHEKALGYDEMTKRAASAPAGSDAPVLPSVPDRREARRASQRARAVLRPRRGSRTGPLASRRPRGRRLRRGATSSHHGACRRPSARAGHRLRGRRQDRTVAEDQGERLRGPDRRSEGARVRRRRVRGDGGDRDRPVLQARRRGRRLRASCGRGAPRPGMGRRLRAHAPVFDKLYVHSQALYDDLDALAVGAAGETSRRAALHGE